MTIRKGQPYGEPASEAPDVVVASDREASEQLEQARRSQAPFPVLGLSAGDLCHTLGGTGALQNIFPVDLGEALIDGRLHYFVAHLVVRDRWWHRSTVAMNAQWLGEWNLGPKAHPNDGHLDTYEAALSWTDRLKVRQRLASGSHLPHPRIEAKRTDHRPIDLVGRQRVYLDGVDMGTARHVLVRLLPDALRVVA
jgi:hypothetical protein